MTRERERAIRAKSYTVDFTPEIHELLDEVNNLRALLKESKREINILRQYGNKDCTAMADEKLAELRSEE